jgi:hypothetical protein
MADFAIVLWAWQPRAGRHKGAIDYGPPLANMQAAAIERHLHMQHEIVCVTDYPAHLFDSRIRVVPLWEDWRELGKCYTRLRAFAPDMKELIAPTFAWIDLDCVVIRDLAPLFATPYEFRIWRSGSLPTQPYNGSMVQMIAGTRAKVWTEFRDRPQIAAEARQQGYRGSDQAIIGHVLGRSEPTWTVQDGVLHLGMNCSGRRFAPPEHARIIFSPGGQKVTDPLMQRRFPWLTGFLTRPEETVRLDVPRWATGGFPPPPKPGDQPPKYFKPRWRRVQEMRREAKLAARLAV